MERQQIIDQLKQIDSEYMFRDIGFGGFYGNDNTFKANGLVYVPTTKELQEMLDNVEY
jgi:hypothetical protein